MADNFGGSENIFYIDDGNIVLIDPNSIIDSNGQKKDRVIKQENMVMYANLEVDSVPRTKLAVGQGIESGINNVNLASLNFLKPQDKNVLDTSYTDQLTGGRNLQGGVNQISFTTNQNPQQTNYVDTQLLGIKNISVDIKFNGVPEVSMTLVDVQGRSLFETGGNSPYSVFLYYPYPMFRLTLKGYYGKAIQYELMLLNFNASFDSSTGNYLVDLKFIARTSAILDDIRLGYLFALPNMYPSYQIPTVNDDNTSQQGTASTQQIGVGNTQELDINTSSKGYDKIKQVFEEYKQKGLIDDNVPVLTLNEMSVNLQKYTQFLNEEFDKLDFKRVVALTRYKESVDKFNENLNKWRETFIELDDVIVLKESSKGRILYGLKNITFVTDVNGNKSKESNLVVKQNAETKLTGLTLSFKSEINSVPIWNNEISISNDIYEIEFFKEKFTENDIDFNETYRKRVGRIATSITDPAFISFKTNLISSLNNKGVFNSDITDGNPYYYTFDKINTEINSLNGIIVQKEQQENENLNTVLLNQIKVKGNTTNLVFRPTVRNVIGVIMASVDAFYRMMDDVHKNAWNQRQNSYRLSSILQNIPSQEGKDAVTTADGQNQSRLIYPWPQFVQKKETSGKVDYQVTYPGSKSVSNFTKGYDPRVWPEVEFVEQYLNAIVQKELKYDSNVQGNGDIVLKYTPTSAIEFNLLNNVYVNQQVVDFMYEFYERLLLNVFYSGLYYTQSDRDLTYVGSQIEYNNIINSGLGYGELRDILINQLPTTNLYDFLKSTGGDNEEGTKWNNFKLQKFNTNYINDKVQNSFNIYSESGFNQLSLKPVKISAVDDIGKYLKSTNTNQKTLFDTYPFTIDKWKSKLESSTNNIYSTIESLGFDNGNLMITNYSNKKVSYLNKLSSSLSGFTKSDIINHSIIKDYYTQRFDDSKYRLITEGNITYGDDNLSSKQTTSILNTPYFINSLMDASSITGNTQLVTSAYLFLNSLPLSTLYERFLDISSGKKGEYIFASLNKFSAIHKIPFAWVLKMGSVWHRYKKYINDGVDILDSAWKDFDYKMAYDPITSSTTKNYQICINGSDTKTTFVLNGTNNINVGFYPELYNNFYKLFTGYDLFKNNDVNDKDVDFYKNNLKVVNQPVLDTLNGPISSYFSYFKIDNNFVNFFSPEDINKSLILPSAGYVPFQQSYYEVTTDDSGNIGKDVLVDNNGMYNGTAKLFWGSPNYGWFDNTKINKPEYNEYLKYIRPGSDDNQVEFDLGSQYSKIEDLFGVFNKEQLDFFENEFLEFCKDDGESKIYLKSDEIDDSYGNFKSLLRKLFILDIGDSLSARNISDIQTNEINQTITKFLNINVYLKNGNPKEFDRYSFGIFQNELKLKPENIDKSTYGAYITNTLPTSGGITLEQSKVQNPDAWKALQTNVGFSTIDGISYGETSTIYDFFIDNDIQFNVTNIESLSKLIKMYATKKYENSNYNATLFGEDLTTLMNLPFTKRNDIENQIKFRLSNGLENQEPITETSFNTVNGDAIKLETWELFKSVNDKWVSGIDFSNRLLFDEFLFFDRSNRDIGDELIVNVDTIRKYCIWENGNTSIMSLIRQILSNNRMNFFVMPAYINFYGKPSSRSTNRNQSILQNANDVFSTFTYVDYIDSAPKFLCQYVDRPSQTLSMDNDPKYPFKSDSFDLGNQAGNPIRNTTPVPESQQFKNNKAVGFVVDFGVQNQSIFKSIEITQNQNVTSSEQIDTIIGMGLQGSGKQTAQQTTALFEFYKNRSYDCTVKIIGNVMIQPTMYFVIRHMPMFNGTYMIRNVKHTISPGAFNTEFQGQRISSTINAKITDELAAVNQDFTKKLQDKIKVFVNNNTIVTFNSSINQYITNPQEAKDYLISGRTPYQGNIVKSKNNKEQICYENIHESLSRIINVDYSEQNITQTTLVNLLKTNVTDERLRLYLYTLVYLLGYKNEKNITYKQNNLYGVTADINWGGLSTKINGYRCLTTPENNVIPFASFETLQKNIELVRDFYENKITPYFNTNNTGNTCVNEVEYSALSIDNLECTALTFINIFYNTWYTSGNNAKIYSESPQFNDWLGIAKSAITKGLRSDTGLI